MANFHDDRFDKLKEHEADRSIPSVLCSAELCLQQYEETYSYYLK